VLVHRLCSPGAVPLHRVPEPPADRPDCGQLATALERNLTPELAAELLAALGLPTWAAEHLPAVGVGWLEPTRKKSGQWSFRERDGGGKTVGVSTRPRGDGPKGFVRDTHRGLTVPDGWEGRAVAQGRLYLVEGASDTLALWAAGLAVIGRPSNVGGVADTAGLLKDLARGVRVIVVGENDRKPDGRWPGRVGAWLVALQLGKRLGRRVCWGMVPEAGKTGDRRGRRRKGEMYKDVRDYLTGRAGRTAAPEKWAASGRELAAAIDATAAPAECPSLIPSPRELADDFGRPACPTPFRLQFRHKPDSPRAGQYSAACVRCDKWACPKCGRVKAGNTIRDVATVLPRFVDPDCRENTGYDPWPGDPGNLGAVGPWNLVAYVVTDARRRQIVRAVSRVGGEVAWVRTLAGRDDLEAALNGDGADGDGGLWKNRRLKTSDPDPSEYLKSAVFPFSHLVLTVLPPGTTAPEGGLPVGPVEWVALFRAALSKLPTVPDEPDGRLRPVYVSDGLRLPDAELPGQAERIGTTAFPPAVIKNEVLVPLGIVAEAEVGGKNVQGRAVGWRTGHPLTDWLVSALVGPGRPIDPIPAEDIPTIYRRWEKVLRPLAATVGDPGPEVKRLIGLYLWTGPPLYQFGDELVPAVEADRRHAEERQRMRAFHAEAEQIRRDLRAGCPDPATWSELTRMILGDPMSDAERRQRTKRARRKAVPKWRAGDHTKTKAGQEVARTIGR